MAEVQAVETRQSETRTSRKAGTIRVGLLGATSRFWLSYIAQRALFQLEDHPQIEIAAFIADEPGDVGKTVGDLQPHTWLAETDLPEKYAGFKLLPVEPTALKKAGIDLVLSTLAGPKARELDPIVASAGIAVVSESVGLRLDADVPLIVPEVNADHLRLIRRQRQVRGWSRGLVVANPVCTAVVIALAMKPFIDAYGMRACVMTTLQALSGAGPNGVPAMAILDSLLPFIDQEEEKLSTELPKIFGTYRDGEITPHAAPFSCTATRIPIRDGHTASITLDLEQSPDLEAIPALVDRFRGRMPGAEMPHAPGQPLIYRPEPNRPQPKLDRDRGNGMCVSVGRVRRAAVFGNGLSFVAVGHNHSRGTFGNSVLLAELLIAEGLVSPQ